MFLLSYNFLIEVLNEDLKDIILKYFYVKLFFNIYSEKKTKKHLILVITLFFILSVSQKPIVCGTRESVKWPYLVICVYFAE